jgi:uncharacterized membrane protein YcjF (UPF0283 family)
MATSISHIHHQSEFYLYLKQRLRILDDVNSVTSGLNALDVLQREQRHREENKRIADEWKAEQERDREERLERERCEAREKKSDNKIQAIMGLFGTLAIASAFVDSFDFISEISRKETWSELSRLAIGAEIFFILIIALISVITLYFAIKSLIDAFKDKD